MSKLDKILETLNVDAIILTDYYNKRYFTGFTGTSGTAFITKNKKIFVSDFRYTEQATKQVSEYGFNFVEDNTRSYDTFIKICKEENIKSIAFDNLNISYSEYKRLQNAFENIKLVEGSNEFLKCRRIKSKEEIEKIEKAIKISEEAILETIKFIKEGQTEIEIAAFLEYQQRKRGAQKTSFDTIVASGKRSAMPHGVASNKVVKKGEFITIDYGCEYNGYVSDITRTFFLGDVIEDRMYEIYETVRKSNELGISLLKPGMKVSEVDKAVREFMKDDAKYFGHSLGHSFGLEVHEGPMLSSRDSSVLEEGMIVTIEPGIYINNYAGVRIEDDVLITKDGHRVLTSLDKKLLKL